MISTTYFVNKFGEQTLTIRINENDGAGGKISWSCDVTVCTVSIPSPQTVRRMTLDNLEDSRTALKFDKTKIYLKRYRVDKAFELIIDVNRALEQTSTSA